MSSTTLEPNRIHSLPVIVNYHLPSSSQIFTTLFNAPQQVYVHPNAAGARDGEDDTWGSIYLKTVVQGVIFASPELHPVHPSTTDLSVYIYDPRETSLRRARAPTPFPNYSQNQRTSSPISDASSPGLPPTATEVWTGKGLMSWALEEPGEGKNLITGRLVRSTEFARVNKWPEMDPLDALMMADMEGEVESWGIEISLSLKSGAGGSIGAHPSVQSAASRRTSLVNEVATKVQMTASRGGQGLRLPSQPTRPLSPSRIVSTKPQTKATAARVTSVGNVRGPAGKKRKSQQPTPPPVKAPVPLVRPALPHHVRPSSAVTAPTPNAVASSSRTPLPASDASSMESFPNDIPAELYSNPASLTKEQAERLIASPAFLSMLERLTGQPIDAATGQKRAADTRLDAANGKRAKTDGGIGEGDSGAAAPLKCYNCGRTKSAVWRTKVMEDGQSVRVCNACGLYWNKLRQMRPPTLWQGLDDDVGKRPREEKDKKPGSTPIPMTPVAATDHPASRMDSGGFKRTLSAVVEQDAKRIASLRTRPSINVKSGLSQSSKPVPMTSPPRATRSMRNQRWNGDAQAGASSPGGWMEPMHGTNQVAAVTDDFNPVSESPNTTIRRILGTSNQPVQSLDLPLSDDKPTDQVEWSTNLSAFFDVEGFSTDQATHGRSPTPETTDFHRALSSGARKKREQGLRRTYSVAETETDDDVISQLFNRTSSAGIGSSSPAPFDFSQLPPSSPPVSLSSDLPHSALLLSSPDLSSPSFSGSPLDQPITTTATTTTYNITRRWTPEKKSSLLRQSFIPGMTKVESFDFGEFLHTSQSTPGDGGGGVEMDFGMGMGEWELFGGTGNVNGGGMESSSGAAEGMLGGGSGSSHTGLGMGSGSDGEDWLRAFSDSLGG